MPVSGPILVICAGIAFVYWAGAPVVHAVQKAEHKIAAKLHHHRKPAASQSPKVQRTAPQAGVPGAH